MSSSNFLDVAEKIRNYESLLVEYEEGLRNAEEINDNEKIKYYTKCIEETEHIISAMKNSPYYNG